MVGCTGDVSHTDQGKCRLCLMINRWRQESTLLLQAQNVVMYSLSCLNVSSYHFCVLTYFNNTQIRCGALTNANDGIECKVV